MYSDVIGIVGGMGSYATLSFFERLLEAFPAEKEWDRPRVLIDNRCTMPSRVRAILYQEGVDQLVNELAESVKRLIESGATKIVLACNTSHYFLPMIYERVPEAEGVIVDMIQTTVDTVRQYSSESVSLLASEGTIDSGIFHEAFTKAGIKVLTPGENEFSLQREVIESVKQHKITDNARGTLIELINSSTAETVIIGCTEFPVIYRSIDQSNINGKHVVDPLQCVINRLVLEMR